MAILIFLVVFFGLFLVWKEHKKYLETGEQNLWSKIALWGVDNFSPMGFGVIIVVAAIARVWLLVILVGCVWIVYRMIRRNMANADKVEEKP